MNASHPSLPFLKAPAHPVFPDIAVFVSRYSGNQTLPEFPRSVPPIGLSERDGHPLLLLRVFRPVIRRRMVCRCGTSDRFLSGLLFPRQFAPEPFCPQKRKRSLFLFRSACLNESHNKAFRPGDRFGRFLRFAAAQIHEGCYRNPAEKRRERYVCFKHDFGLIRKYRSARLTAFFVPKLPGKPKAYRL